MPGAVSPSVAAASFVSIALTAASVIRIATATTLSPLVIGSTNRGIDPMSYLHEQFTGGPASVVTVELDRQANVLLLDPANYSAFRAGRRFRYHGGRAVKSPCILNPPHHGTWHVVVQPDPGGRVRASISISAA